MVADTIVVHARAIRHPDWDAAIVYGGVDGRPRVIAYGVRAGTTAYGFVNDIGAFGDAAFAPVVRKRLRPDAEWRRPPRATTR